MKLPKFFHRSASPKKKKLRASTAGRAFDNDEFEEMAEPNMKLSRALLIVLVLHVVAVAGIIAFNTIKSRQGAFPSPPPAKSIAKSEAAQAAASASPAAVAKTNATPEASIPRALPVNASSSADTNGNSYTVQKGDNPVKIAKKLKVSESDLLATNHIDDPRKLQIGQKLIVPQKKLPPSKGKKSASND